MEYDKITASHYAAYRPPLHKLILSACLKSDAQYSQGLDVGCGTGHSSIALSQYCREVIGIEPSDEMLGQGIKHPAVSYLKFDGLKLKFNKSYFDIITFAGSLYYAKTQILLNEVVRVCLPGATILIYDFEVDLTDTFRQLGIDQNQFPASPYNHNETFEGLNQQHLALLKTAKKETSFSLTAADLSHLILSSKAQYTTIGQLYGCSQLYYKLHRALEHIYSNLKLEIPVKLYYTVYKCAKD